MPFIYLTPMLSCEPRIFMFIINGYYIKSKHLQSLDCLSKDVIIYFYVLLDQAGNTVDDTVQRQHLKQYIKLIFTQRMSSDQFQSLFYCDCQKLNLTSASISLLMVTGRGIFTCSAGQLSRGHPHSPNVNHCVSTILTKRSPRAS